MAFRRNANKRIESNRIADKGFLHRSHGIFRLTDPTGKDAILSCHQSGIFHPHAQTNLYTDALRPGHVCELKGLQFQVVDLRDK